MMTMTGYFAAEGFEAELEHDLGAVERRFGRLLLAAGPARPMPWAQNIWYDPQPISISSIGDGAKKLRAIQRNWSLYNFHLHRRANLIQDKLPHVSAKPVVFPSPLPTAPLGAWTLIDENTILASPQCSSPYRHGEVEFVEDRLGPPNRAYLKLWDVLTVLGKTPQPGELCLDLGACPGGWTWVLAKLGCRVISIDKAPLDPAVMAMPGVEFRQESVFGLDPASIGPVDWLFCDVICYPERLLSMLKRWMAAGQVRNFICTVKFQGETDFATAAALADIHGSELRHLYHNKHELTWIKLAA